MLKKLGLLLIRAYQICLSPVFGGACRFYPTCSHYGYEAIERFGFWRGSWLALRRIARCNPFGPHGPDPVPLVWPGWFTAHRHFFDTPASPHEQER